MTDESRRAFDAEWLKYTPEDDKPYSKIIAENFWQASEARILALLESEEMVEVVAKAIHQEYNYYVGQMDTSDWVLWTKEAKSAIEAIKQRINKGE